MQSAVQNNDRDPAESFYESLYDYYVLAVKRPDPMRCGVVPGPDRYWPLAGLCLIRVRHA